MAEQTSASPKITLVTGASGHVGSNVVRLLVEQGRAVRALVRPTSDLRSLQGVDCELVRGDVLDATSIARAVNGCQSVFHVAAVNRMTSADPQDIIRPAVEGTRHVLEACIREGVERVVYTSTVAVLGRVDTEGECLTEERSAPASAIPYVQGKIEAERWVLEFHRRTGLPVVIVNPSAILGPFDYRPTPVNHLVVNVLKRRLAPVLPGGLNVVDVRDVARGHLLAELRGRPGARYVLGGTNLTHAELIGKIERAAGQTVLRLTVPRWLVWIGAGAIECAWRVAGRHPPMTRAMVREFFGRYTFCDSTKARQELGYYTRSVEETLRDTVGWFRGSSYNLSRL